MADALPSAAGGRWWPPGRFVLRTGRRTVVDSLYLLSAPLTALAGLLLVLAGLCAAAVGALVPGGSAAARGGIGLARWSADFERWRIARVRPRLTGTPQPAGPGQAAGRLSRPPADAARLWLEVAHAVAVLPVVLVTSLLTAWWWFFGLALISFPVRNAGTGYSSPRPQTLYIGTGQSHIDLSLGLTTPAAKLAFALGVGLLALGTLPLVTRACVAVQAGLGQTLLSDMSALHRRIRGLEQERDTARAQAVAAVTAEAASLRRLERDIHDGPQQRLVRLSMELGRAQHHFDRRPELVREALADAVTQAQEALDELRALSRGIVPPILADRGLRAALADLAGRSTVPAELDAAFVDHQLDVGVETAAYFVAAEALTNVAKHSGAQGCQVGLRHEPGTLRVWVTDDGAGGAALGKGHGLRGLDDRVRAAGGRLTVDSPDGGPTTVAAELPCK